MSQAIVTQGLGNANGIAVTFGYGESWYSTFPTISYIFDITLPISTAKDIFVPIIDTELNIILPISTSEDITTPIETTKGVTLPISKEDDIII